MGRVPAISRFSGLVASFIETQKRTGLVASLIGVHSHPRRPVGRRCGGSLKHTFFGNRLFVGLLALTTATVAWAQPPVITTGPNLGTWTIGVVTLPLQATGGNGVYGW